MKTVLKTCGPVAATEPLEAVCAAGIRKTLAPVLVRERVVGYVCGLHIAPQESSIGGLSALQHSAPTCPPRKQEAAPNTAGVLVEVRRVAHRLSRRAAEERRGRIFADARALMLRARTPEGIVDTVCRAIEALFGAVDVSLYALKEDGAIHLVAGRGPHEWGPSQDTDAGRRACWVGRKE